VRAIIHKNEVLNVIGTSAWKRKCKFYMPLTLYTK